MRALLFTDAFRVYFNRHNADGLSWCVSPESGAWEIGVKTLAINTPTTTVHKPKATPDDEDGRPSAWVSTRGALFLEMDGSATIAACDNCGDVGSAGGIPCRCRTRGAR